PLALVWGKPRGQSPPLRVGCFRFVAHPLPGRLGAGFRFFPRPFPAAPWAPLASRCPLRGGRRAYHVPPMCLGGEGRSSSPVVRHLRRWSSEPPDLTTCRFGPSVSASCARSW